MSRRRQNRSSARTAPSPSTSTRWPAFAVGGLLILLTVFTFSDVRRFEFLGFDDPDYVSDNPYVASGLTADGLAWSLTTTHAGNWHPVTWWSHMLDASLYGPDAGGHHLTSVILAALNAVLLFALLNTMTRSIWRSAFVAALFAVHPMHVESVAWISERKDVLSTTFGLLAMLGYVAHVRAPSRGKQIAIIVMFALSLMAKPMLVTLPILLLLFDLWPLARLTPPLSFRTLWPFVREKAPLLIMSAIAAAITIVAQRGSVRTLQEIPLPLRLSSVITSYVTYIGKMFWPVRLDAFYRYPSAISWPALLGGAAVLVGVSALAVRQFRARPYIAAGWFWFLISMVPVIGIVQVGRQAMADRYTYLPFVGLFIIVAWIAYEGILRRPSSRWVFAAAAITSVLACTVLARSQVRTWESDLTLWEHALSVDPANAMAHHSLGTAYAAAGRFDEAIAHDREALRLDPQMTEAWTNLGATLGRQGKEDEAMEAYRQAIRVGPNDPVPHINLGRTLARVGRVDEAVAEFRSALAIAPEDAEARSSLGVALVNQGRVDDGIREFEAALQTNPRDPLTHLQLGSAMEVKGNAAAALDHYLAAIRIAPDLAAAHASLGSLYSRTGQNDPAIQEYQIALDLQPSDPRLHYEVAVVYVAIGNKDAARQHLDAALTIAPEFSDARRLLDQLKK